MRLAVLSDIHGNLLALEAVLADIEARGVDAIVNLGDCVTSPLWPSETLALLDAIDMPTVRGNHDGALSTLPLAEMPRSVRYTHDSLTAAQRQRLAALPATIELDGGGILAVHGTPDSNVEYLLHDKVDGRIALASGADVALRLERVSAGLVLCGHSHTQHLVWVQDCLAFNPGSVGCPRYTDDDDPFVAEAGAPLARYAIVEQRAKRWSAEMIAINYDWEHVLQRAIANGRPDWAAGFLGEKVVS